MCASGISPSGPIHLGNLREVMTPHLVADEVRRRGIEVEHIISWDDFDRFRKVPNGCRASTTSWEEHIGKPLTDVPAAAGFDRDTLGRALPRPAARTVSPSSASVTAGSARPVSTCPAPTPSRSSSPCRSAARSTRCSISTARSARRRQRSSRSSPRRRPPLRKRRRRAPAPLPRTTVAATRATTPTSPTAPSAVPTSPR